MEKQLRDPEAGRTGRHRVRRVVVSTLLATVVATAGTAVGTVATAAPAEAATSTRIVVTTTVTRTAPSVKARVRTKVVRSQRVTVTARRTGWVRTTKGWLPTSAVSNGNRYADVVAASKGLRVTYTNNQLCGRRTSVSTARSFVGSGCYQQGARQIQLTTSAAYDGSARWKRAAIRDLVLHEAAHYAIYRATGTVRPAIAGARWEQVTEAYAWYYYRTTSKAPGGYGFAARDLAAAKAIHG